MIAGIIFCLFLPCESVLAQPSLEGLSISPIRTEFDVKPGASYTSNLQVTNNSPVTISVSLSAEEFKISDAQYDYSFNPSSGLARWVSFASTNITLSSKSTRAVQYTVAAPLDIEPHGEYISLFATVQNTPSSSSGLMTSERVASLLYITVDGKVSRSGALLSAQNPWLITASGTWSTSIRNKGTTHFRSISSITTQTIFGAQIGSSATFNSLILPDTVRDITGPIPSPQLPGIYKLVYSVGLGDTPVTHLTRYFLYLPLIPSLILLGCLCVVIGFIPKRRKHTQNDEPSPN